MSIPNDVDALSMFLESHDAPESHGQTPAVPVFKVGQKCEALLGKERVCTVGHVIYDNEDGTYAVYFESGHEFSAVDGGILTLVVDRILEIETQLAQVRWRKMQNEGNIRTMLESSRELQEHDLLRQLEQDRSKEKSEWMQGIIDDELSKPLEVTENYMQTFEAEEAVLRSKREADRRQHVASVEHLEKKLWQREAAAREGLMALEEKHEAAWRQAGELHTKIIQTQHVLAADYLNGQGDCSPGEGLGGEQGLELDDGDRVTIGLLRKRVEMLTEAWTKADAIEGGLGAKVLKARQDLESGFKPIPVAITPQLPQTSFNSNNNNKASNSDDDPRGFLPPAVTTTNGGGGGFAGTFEGQTSGGRAESLEEVSEGFAHSLAREDGGFTGLMSGGEGAMGSQQEAAAGRAQAASLALSSVGTNSASVHGGFDFLLLVFALSLFYPSLVFLSCAGQNFFGIGTSSAILVYRNTQLFNCPNFPLGHRFISCHVCRLVELRATLKDKYGMGPEMRTLERRALNRRGGSGPAAR
mmetsp:Transcript_81640/g.162959  ORF Transcript_81640/g.162959 Transcript_81640/m.162959 type:complete len:527 (+) Transcript_81640:95-1675(+)